MVNNLLYGLLITVLGMGIVFVVLVLLQFILKLMGMKFGVHADTVEGYGADRHKDTVQDEYDPELIAVISAAIAASMGTESRIVVRSIRRINDITPTWGKAGRNDVMANRF